MLIIERSVTPGFNKWRAPNRPAEIKIPTKIFDLAVTVGNSQPRVTNSSVPPCKIQNGIKAMIKSKGSKLRWLSSNLPRPVSKSKTTMRENCAAPIKNPCPNSLNQFSLKKPRLEKGLFSTHFTQRKRAKEIKEKRKSWMKII